MRKGGGAERTIGLAGLTLVALTSMVGSGWLFAPMLAAQAAGPAALIAWVVGGLAMLLVALTFAEVAAILPVTGGIARIPETAHGALNGMLMGWTSWIGCAAIASLETLILLRYLAPLAPWVYADGQHDGSAIYLSAWGWLVALALLALIGLTILFGARLFARVNNGITALKMALPVIVAVALLGDQLDLGNFTGHGSSGQVSGGQGGFMPFGLPGIFAALSTGGVIFSYIGWRNVIDLAGDARNPQFTLPASLFLGIAAAMALYSLLQFVMIANLPASSLAQGWGKLHFGESLGPFAAVAAVAGLLWLGIVIHTAAIVSPFGTGLGMMGAATRLLQGMAQGRMLPPAFAVLTRHGIPLLSLAVNLVLAVGLMFMPFGSLVTLVTGAVALSLISGPVALNAFRRELPDHPRRFRLPLAWPMTFLSVWIITLLIYWGGWDTVRVLAGLVALGAVLHPVLRRPDGPPSQWRRSLWLLVWIAGVAALSWLGEFGGGLGWITFGWDLAAAALVAAIGQGLAYLSRRPAAEIRALLDEHDA